MCFSARQGGGAGRQLRFEILALQRQISYLRLDLSDFLLPILKDEQLLQFRLHARMLWAERSAVNRRSQGAAISDRRQRTAV